MVGRGLDIHSPSTCECFVLPKSPPAPSRGSCCPSWSHPSVPRIVWGGWTLEANLLNKGGSECGGVSSPGWMSAAGCPAFLVHGGNAPGSGPVPAGQPGPRVPRAAPMCPPCTCCLTLPTTPSPCLGPATLQTRLQVVGVPRSVSLSGCQ